MTRKSQILQILEVPVANAVMDNRTQVMAIAALSQSSARARVAASAPTALTDSSTGTAGSTLQAIVSPTTGLKDGATTFAAKAEFDTTIGLIEDAHRELLAKANEIVVLVAGGTARTVEDITTGAAANNVIDAITPSLTGGTTNVVDDTTGIAQIVIARNNQAAISAMVNWCRVAMGLDTLSDGTGGVFEVSSTEYTTTDAAATAAAVTTNGDGTLVLATTSATLDALVDNIAKLAAVLNEMRGTLAIGPFVVAVSAAYTRMTAADVTV